MENENLSHAFVSETKMQHKQTLETIQEELAVTFRMHDNLISSRIDETLS